jgi:flagellar biosynthesis/type III secretory pathway protein FliH
VTPKAAGSTIEAAQGLKQVLKKTKKIEVMKAEFQPEFTKLSDRMAKEVMRTTAQVTKELLQVREQVTEVRSELDLLQ